jgi:hypothetical protein
MLFESACRRRALELLKAKREDAKKELIRDFRGSKLTIRKSVMKIISSLLRLKNKNSVR